MAQPIARSSASTFEGKRRSARRRSASYGPERARRGMTRAGNSRRSEPPPLEAAPHGEERGPGTSPGPRLAPRLGPYDPSVAEAARDVYHTL